MHPLPARPTGRAGIETSALDRSEDAFDGRSLAGSSTADLTVHPAANPYSLPADPQQHYYDDPANAAGGPYLPGGVPPGGAAYYDPYRGPVPPTLSPRAGEEDPYAVQGDPYGRTGSPGPHAAYDLPPQPGYDNRQSGYEAYGAAPGGRAPSPGPNVAYGGRASPGPQAAYGRSGSPGPEAAYGVPRTTSPGPQAAYGGRGSPGPDNAYGGYR